jgi:hypothetical protein
VSIIPHLEENFLRVLRDRTAGDPMRQEVRWTDLTHERIAEHLAEAGTPVSVPVVKRLLGRHRYVTRKAQKSTAMGGHPDRDRQFENIARLKREYWGSDDPIVSMDTKKKELRALAKITYPIDLLRFKETSHELSGYG